MDKLHNCNIVLLGGLYGSGKTEFAIKQFMNRSRYRISRSEIRRLLFEMTNFGKQWTADMFNEEDDVLVKHVERKIIEHYLQNKRNVLVINTFTSVESRKRFITIAKDMNKSLGIVFLDVPVNICLQNNEAKSSGVPAYVVQKLSNKKVLPSKNEGFSEVLIVTNPNP
ncbi:MAG: ATP-binding protein [Spirochaetes bacterium]|nr:ATP-binding protein [Spirochaetota bacterium]